MSCRCTGMAFSVVIIARTRTLHMRPDKHQWCLNSITIYYAVKLWLHSML